MLADVPTEIHHVVVEEVDTGHFLDKHTDYLAATYQEVEQLLYKIKGVILGANQMKVMSICHFKELDRRWIWNHTSM